MTTKITVLVLFLATICSAGPNTALVKVLKGEARLGNRTYRSGFLVSNGDKLVVTKGSEVMLKFLQESVQKRIVGPVSLTIDIEAQRSDAVAVKRGEMKVAESLGMRSRTGGMTVRGTSHSSEEARLENAAPKLVVESSGVAKLVLFDGEAERVTDRFDYRVEVIDDDTGETLVEEEVNPTSVAQGIPLKGFKAGRTYLVEVYDAGSLDASRSLLLRALTQDQEESLKQAEKELLSAYESTNDPLILLNLAECYLSLDQSAMALETLSRFEDAKLGQDFQDALDALRKRTMMPLKM